MPTPRLLPPRNERPTAMKFDSSLFPCAAALIASTASSAGFVGWVGVARAAPGAPNYVMVDIFAGVANASDRFLSVSDMTITTTAIGGFFQSSDPASKAFRPDTANYSASRNSVDSFVTAGGIFPGDPQGPYYASAFVQGDANFVGYEPTPVSTQQNSFPPLAGWYTTDPAAIDNAATNLSQISNRQGASTIYGIWVGHMVVRRETPAPTITWNGSATIRDGVTGTTEQGYGSQLFVAPAPGAAALAALAGLAGLPRGRRRH